MQIDRPRRKVELLGELEVQVGKLGILVAGEG